MTRINFIERDETLLRRFAREHDCRQVIVVAFDGARTHVATYGRTIDDCDQAAQGGDIVKRAINWPDNLLGALPPRLERMKLEIEKLRTFLARQAQDLAFYRKRRGELVIERDEWKSRCGALLASIDWLTEVTGEAPEDEDAAIVDEIRKALGAGHG